MSERSFRHRTTDIARDALRRFCDAAGNRGTPHIFTIPVDEDRDADRILDDVITERDTLQKRIDKAVASIDAEIAACIQERGEGAEMDECSSCEQARARRTILVPPKEPTP